MDPLTVLAAITTVANAAGSVKSLFGDKKGGGGVGGAASAETQSGSDIPFTPVGIETLEISPFDYMEMQREFEQEQTEIEQMQYGGPLYAAGGMPIGKGFLEIMSPILGNTGLIQALFANLNKEDDEEDEEESIVPGLNAGGGIGDLFDPEIFANFEPEMPKPPPSGEVAADLEKQNRQDMIFQTLKDIPEFAKAIGKLKKSPQKISVSGRGNVVPGAKGGRAYRQQRQETVNTGITPFEYKAMQGGGALNRQMFAQNYMPNGGDIRGPGGPKDDLIPVMASNGEYMLSKAAVDQAGGGNHARGIANLEQFNDRGNRRYG